MVSVAVITLRSAADLNAQFSAHFPGGQNLARIEKSSRIEDLLQATHHVEVVWGENQGHQLIFFDAYAVLARDGAAHFGAPRHYFARGGEHLLGLLRIAGVEKQQGMKVSIPGMKNVADEQAVLLAHRGDEFQHLRKARTRDHAVLDVEIRADASERAEGVLPASP